MAKLAPWEKQLSKEQKAAAAALGINNVNKVDELNRINAYVESAQKSKTDPVYQQVAKNLGITNYNSVNDYAQVVNAMVSPTAPAAQPAQPVAQQIPPAPAWSPKFPQMESSMPTIGPPIELPSQRSAMDDSAALIEQMKIDSQKQIESLMEQFQQQEAERLAELEKMREEQRSMMINQARSLSPANLQLGIGFNKNQLAGTEGFKVQKKQTPTAPIAFSAPTLAASAASQVPTVLNV